MGSSGGLAICCELADHLCASRSYRHPVTSDQGRYVGDCRGDSGGMGPAVGRVTFPVSSTRNGFGEKVGHEKITDGPMI